MTIHTMKYASFDEPNHDVSFDDTATSAMGEAFDRTFASLHQFGIRYRFKISVPMREAIARWFIDAAKNGERDFSRLHDQAHEAFGIVAISMLAFSRFDGENPDHGKRTFDCVPCDQSEPVIVQYR